MFSVLNSYLCATIRKNVQVNMKRFNYFLISALAALMLACGTSSKVPITGRKHSLLVSDSQILSLSKQEYSKFLSSAKLSSNAANTAMVKRVGQRLAKAVETYLVNNGYQDELKNFEWEFNLVADNQVNAFCMPGGKIVVYEGLLPVSQDEASLATKLHTPWPNIRPNKCRKKCAKPMELRLVEVFLALLADKRWATLHK